mmetsp:Transcript_26711/g.100461  ORF Transcript_26711/g.100461 Transcript_26711/m.100461 type:complete len:318 (+) Transcript_26711:1850-2803(+)
MPHRGRRPRATTAPSLTFRRRQPACCCAWRPTRSLAPQGARTPRCMPGWGGSFGRPRGCPRRRGVSPCRQRCRSQQSWSSRPWTARTRRRREALRRPRALGGRSCCRGGRAPGHGPPRPQGRAPAWKARWSGQCSAAHRRLGQQRHRPRDLRRGSALAAADARPQPGRRPGWGWGPCPSSQLPPLRWNERWGCLAGPRCLRGPAWSVPPWRGAWTWLERAGCGRRLRGWPPRPPPRRWGSERSGSAAPCGPPPPASAPPLRRRDPRQGVAAAAPPAPRGSAPPRQSRRPHRRLSPTPPRPDRPRSRRPPGPRPLSPP